MKMIDLHTHTCFSDGTDTPEELISQAKSAGVEVIALTDHNTVGGVKRFLAEAEKQGVLGVAGIEFSTEYKGKELHILAMPVAERYFDEIEAKMVELKQRKEKSNRALVQKLADLGYDISYDGLVEKYNNVNINRAHIAATLTETGQTPSIKDAFAHLLGEECGIYIPPKRLDTFETIRYIREIGAVPILAHPYLQFEQAALEEFLALATKEGLLGMEVDYSMYDEKTTALAHETAEKFALLKSGGSDHHGRNKPHITLGKGQGNLAIPRDYWDAIFQKYQEIQHT